MESKEINILVMAKGPSFELAYENLCQKLAKKYPNIHLYRIEPNTDYTKDLEKLKDIKFDILTGLPLFVPLTRDIITIIILIISFVKLLE